MTLPTAKAPNSPLVKLLVLNKLFKGNATSQALQQQQNNTVGLRGAVKKRNPQK